MAEECDLENESRNGAQAIDAIDAALLELVQKGIPITSRPFKEIGDVLGLQEEEIIERLRMLRERGVIRRIGGIFNSRALGFTSALIGFSVAPDRVERVAAVINNYTCVTHNYLRDGYPNLWFTLICENRKVMQDIISDIAGKVRPEDMLILFTEEVFKISTVFPLAHDASASTSPTAAGD